MYVLDTDLKVKTLDLFCFSFPLIRPFLFIVTSALPDNKLSYLKKASHSVIFLSLLPSGELCLSRIVVSTHSLFNGNLCRREQKRLKNTANLNYTSIFHYKSTSSMHGRHIINYYNVQFSPITSIIMRYI